MAQCICSGCNEAFKSSASFEKHRLGDYGQAVYKVSASSGKRQNTAGQTDSTRRCMTAEEMISAGMSKNERGLWIAKEYDPQAHI